MTYLSGSGDDIEESVATPRTAEADAGSPAPSLAARFESPDGEHFLSGVQSLVRVILDRRRRDLAAGLNTAAFVCGYPGSPLGGLDRELQRHRGLLEALNVVHRPGLNEDLAATAVMGSQLATTFSRSRVQGVAGFWYGKAPGLDRSMDAIRHAVFAGAAAYGGAVALVGDDPGCTSSTLPSSSERLLAEAAIPVLFPGDIQEVLDLGVHAVELSRRSGLWTSMKMVTAVADGTGTADVALRRIQIYPSASVNEDRVAGLNQTSPRSLMIERQLEERLAVARDYAVANHLNRVVIDSPDPWLLIIAGGHTYHAVMTALRALSLNEDELGDVGIRVVQLRLLFPLHPEFIRAWCSGVRHVLVLEEKRPFVEAAVRDALYGRQDAPIVLGKRYVDGNELVPGWGALDAVQLVGPLRTVLSARLPAERLSPPAAVVPPVRLLEVSEERTAFFCSGCPHTFGLKAPAEASVGAGIGCHGMVRRLPAERVGQVATVTHMGGEGSQWIGIEPFVEPRAFLQNLGDGTLMHSGYMAIRFAVASGAHMTYKILYNSAVAMTGGQDPTGQLSVPALCRGLLAEGVAGIVITTDDPSRYRSVDLPRAVTVADRAEIIPAQQKLLDIPGVTVLIHDQACAAELRRQRKSGAASTPDQKVLINTRVCEGCGDCGEKSACLSLQPLDTEFGRKTTIAQTSCNIDLSCLQGNCPSFMVVRPGRRARRRPQSHRSFPAPPPALPEPRPMFAESSVSLRLPGIGGTGVVTVAQVLGVAAGLDGRHVAGVDQTGVSQKAGPVVSELRIGPAGSADTGPSAGIDVLLALDLIVAVSPDNLVGLSTGRTHVVGSTSPTPTGSMIVNSSLEYPDRRRMMAEIERYCRPGAFWVDGAAATQALFGDTTTANVFVLGAAYQLGLVPVAAEAIEEALALNGQAVETNRAAFRWGRVAVTDPDRLNAQIDSATAPASTLSPVLDREVAAMALTPDVHALVRRYAADLVGSQGRATARRYVDTVARAHRAENDLDPASHSFAEAVARGLHKVIAYKDEYEVARLLTGAESRAQAEAVGGPGARIEWQLHPPALKALGVKRKVRFGRWSRPMMTMLQYGRILRGTPLDPFGHTEMRREERRLLSEYQHLCQDLIGRLPQAGIERAARLAGLVDMVRGYDDVKLRNLVHYRSVLEEELAVLG